MVTIRARMMVILARLFLYFNLLQELVNLYVLLLTPQRRIVNLAKNSFILIHCIGTTSLGHFSPRKIDQSFLFQRTHIISLTNYLLGEITCIICLCKSIQGWTYMDKEQILYFLDGIGLLVLLLERLD